MFRTRYGVQVAAERYRGRTCLRPQSIYCYHHERSSGSQFRLSSCGVRYRLTSLHSFLSILSFNTPLYIAADIL